jgi:spore germination protein GerM
MTQRRVAGAVAVVTLAVVAACGVPTQDEARTVARDDVPFELLERGTTTSPAPPLLPRPDEVVEVCFLDEDGVLTPLLTRPPGDQTLPSIVAVLAEPPAANDFGVPLTTAVSEPELLEVTRERGLVVVDLDSSFTTMAADDELAAIAQLVCTLTAQPGVGQIRFSLDGTPIEVPRGDGSLTAEPVVRSDYATLLAG